MPEKLLRIPEVQDLLGCCRSKVNKLLRDGDLRSVKIGGSRRIPASALDEFIEGLSGGA
ncbi:MULTISPECIES: helix-turn-helix domain-containing protein [Mycobacteriaceae]|uniref:helix-turn-helix domain-containing protein n=1 Tax=Mycobacteroides abscessus TaxID=36809 RepID=UPI000C26974F|nr:helix-turn-helix domain-containing protein [Mycobacteroides abscessus]